MDKRYRVPKNVHEVYINETGELYAIVQTLVKTLGNGDWQVVNKVEKLEEIHD